MRDFKTRLEALEQQSSNIIPPSVRREVEAIAKRYEDEYRAGGGECKRKRMIYFTSASAEIR